MEAAVAQPVIAAPPKTLKLDLGCGQRCKEGFEGADRYAPGATHKVNLWHFPFPWDDDSVDEIYCSHFAEHIPNRDVEARDIDTGHEHLIDRDLLVVFFDECYRILKPDGVMTVIVPAATSVRAFQDPTHRRYIPAEFFGYLNKGWRDANGLGHYLGACDFNSTVNPVVPTEMTLRHPEAQARMYRESWNCVADWHAVLKPIKGAAK